MTQFHPTISIDAAPPDLPYRLTGLDAQAYEQYTAQILRFILTCDTGQILLREIMGGPGGHSLRIVPFQGSDARTLYSSEQGATPVGKQVVDPKTHAAKRDASGNAIIGTGGGANVTIFYAPVTWLLDTFQTKRIGNLLPDDVLVHELLHGLRMMQGLMSPISAGNSSLDQRFNNTEEFYALVVADIYISERDKKYNMSQPMRANISVPGQFQALTGNDAKSDNFYQQFKGLIDRLCNEMTGLTFGGGLSGLRSVNAAFNPVRSSCDAFDARLQAVFGGSWMPTPTSH